MTDDQSAGQIPDRARADQVHDELRALVGSMGRDFFRFLELVEEVMTEKHYLTKGYSDPAEYFDKAVGYAWPTIRRRLTILESIKRLPTPEARQETLTQLADIGVHKASVLSPVIGVEGTDWRAMLTAAPRLSEGDLQVLVSIATQAKPRGLAAKKAALGGSEVVPEAKWLRIVRSQLEPGDSAEVGNVFSAGRQILGTASDIPALMAMVQEVKVEWTREARAAGWVPPYAESGPNVGLPEGGDHD